MGMLIAPLYGESSTIALQMFSILTMHVHWGAKLSIFVNMRTDQFSIFTRKFILLIIIEVYCN